LPGRDRQRIAWNEALAGRQGRPADDERAGGAGNCGGTNDEAAARQHGFELLDRQTTVQRRLQDVAGLYLHSMQICNR
jgi:hypothetical protein